MIQLYIQCKRKLYHEQIFDLVSLPISPSLSVSWYGFKWDIVVLTERKCKKHVAASKIYNNKLKILSRAIFYVRKSPRLPS